MLNCYHHLHYLLRFTSLFTILVCKVSISGVDVLDIPQICKKYIELHIGGHTAWKLERKEDSHVLKLIGLDQMVILLVTVVICMQGN